MEKYKISLRQLLTQHVSTPVGVATLLAGGILPFVKKFTKPYLIMLICFLKKSPLM